MIEARSSSDMTAVLENVGSLFSWFAVRPQEGEVEGEEGSEGQGSSRLFLPVSLNVIDHLTVHRSCSAT